jgi:hypothetical protein
MWVMGCTPQSHTPSTTPVNRLERQDKFCHGMVHMGRRLTCCSPGGPTTDTCSTLSALPRRSKVMVVSDGGCELWGVKPQTTEFRWVTLRVTEVCNRSLQCKCIVVHPSRDKSLRIARALMPPPPAPASPGSPPKHRLEGTLVLAKDPSHNDTWRTPSVADRIWCHPPPLTTHHEQHRLRAQTLPSQRSAAAFC